MKNKFENKKSNNPSFVILIFEILKYYMNNSEILKFWKESQHAIWALKFI